MNKFVAVAGNVGVGKSVLTDLLSEYMGWRPVHSVVAGNPYLSDFCRDKQAWSFHYQVFYLAKRLKYHREIIDSQSTVVQDRTVYEDAEIWAQSLYDQGYLSERDWLTYWELYQAIISILPPPDLLVYLEASTPVLLQRIEQRGRDFEQQLSVEYLSQINELYDSWINRFRLCPVLRIYGNGLELTHTDLNLGTIVEKILDKLYGRESLVWVSE